MNIYLENFINEKFKKPGKALDLGAGEFCDVNYLEKKGWRCEGVDKLTGVDLENFYKSSKGPYDLVYSNYVLQKIKNKKVFLETVFANLKRGGWLFIHTFDEANKGTNSGVDIIFLKSILESQGFVDIKSKVFDVYDNNPEHRHWHKILEVTARKDSSSLDM